MIDQVLEWVCWVMLGVAIIALIVFIVLAATGNIHDNDCTFYGKVLICR